MEIHFGGKEVDESSNKGTGICLGIGQGGALWRYTPAKVNIDEQMLAI